MFSVGNQLLLNRALYSPEVAPHGSPYAVRTGRARPPRGLIRA